MEIITNNNDETIELGIKIGNVLHKGDIICLSGDLGAGKTTLTKGIGKALDVKTHITSPTFTIMKIYQGRLPLYHMDCYRLEGLNQDIGLDEYLGDDGVSVIEWSLNIKDLIDENLLIDISYLDDEKRLIKIIANGKRYEELIKELETNVNTMR